MEKDYKHICRYNTEQFCRDIGELGICLSSEQTEQFILYYELLTEWNQYMNLTAITAYDEVMKKHFVDSLSLVKAEKDLLKQKDVSLIDLGTGAGFPGLALKIAFPQLNVTLMDSLNKRIKFLDAVIDKLQLKNVKTVHGRAEDFAGRGEMREKYDICVSRAVANLSTLSEYCLPFVKKGGVFVSYKSADSEEEVKEAEYAISVLGGKIRQIIDFTLPDSDIDRAFIVIYKEGLSPRKYPRRAGLPSSEPISNKNK